MLTDTHTESTEAECITMALYAHYIQEYAAALSKLDVSDEAKKHALVSGLRMYAPGIKAIAVTIEDGQVNYVSAIHPQLGFVEVALAEPGTDRIGSFPVSGGSL